MKKLRLVEGQQTSFHLIKESPSDGPPCGSPPSGTPDTPVVPPEVQAERTVVSVDRKFQHKWVTLYPWLRYDEIADAMLCQICLDANRNNTFTQGNRNFKTSSSKDHIKSNDHQTALIVPLLQENNKKASVKQQTGQEKAAIIALKCMYWLAKEGIAVVKFRSLLEFLRSVGVTELDFLSVSPNINYDSDYGAHEFLNSLSDVIEEKTSRMLDESPYVTALADESTDRTVTHRLVIYAQVINPNTMQPWTMYLTNIELHEGTGMALSSKIYEEFAKRGVPKPKIMGLGSDGASVMTGRDKGTTGIMLRENPHLVNVHCIAHRLALCTSQAAQGIPALSEYQEVLTSLFYYFKYSPTRVSKFKAIQDVLDAPFIKMKEVHSVRWMSFYNALEAVYRCLDVMLTYFAQLTLADPKAQGLKKKMGTLKFVSLTHILMYIIPIVSKLNLFFQREITDLALIKVQVDHCISDLKYLLDHDGPYEEQLKKVLGDDPSIFNEHHITRCPNTDIISTKKKFINKIIENIESRFPDTDLLSSYGILSMRPISLLGADELDTWGEDQLDVLLSHFGEEKKHEWKEGKDKMCKTSDAIVDPEIARTEWKELKKTVIAQKYPRISMASLWGLISSYHKNDFPNMLTLAQLALTCPANTAGCERGFSVQNQILTPSAID